MLEWIASELAQIDARGERRSPVPWPEPGPYLRKGERRYLNLASNDYLGLTTDPTIRRAAARAAEEVAPGSTASRLLAGTTDLHVELEQTLAEWKGHPAALVFSSGYLAALGSIPLLAGPGDLILADRLSHACLLDAALFSGARLRRYRHNDVDDLARHLKKRSHFRRCLIVTESIFSMDGDMAPCRDILSLAAEHDAMVFIDEAHAIGVAGPRGAGLTADAPESRERLVTLGTLGKALAAGGGFVTGPPQFRELMINRARTFIFDTALPPPAAAAALAAISWIRANADAPRRLAAKAATVRSRLSAAGLDTLRSQSPIIPVFVGDNRRTVGVGRDLLEQGIVVAAVRPPTVPAGTARLRLSISLAHDDIDLAGAADAVVAALAQSRGQ